MVFLRSFWIDARRGGGWLVLAVVIVAVLVTDLRYAIWDRSRDGTGTPTWWRITAVGTVIVGTYPLIAAYGAWLGSRAGRNKALEMEGLPRRFFIGSAAPSMSAMAIWVGGATALVYLAAATSVIVRARQVSGTEPIGSVPWQSSLVILTAMLAFACVGYLLGRLIPNLFIPVLAAAIVFALFQLPSMLRPPFQPTFWLDSIVPIKLTQAMAPYIGDQVYPRLFWTSLAWFLSIIAVTICTLALWRIRKTVPVVLLVASLVAAGISAVATVRAYDASGAWHAAHRGVACIEDTGILFCAPPAAMSDNDLHATAAAYDALIPAWFPRALLPEQFAVAIQGNQIAPGATEMVPLNRTGPDASWMEMNAWIAIVSGVSPQIAAPTAAQLVIACAMLRANDRDCGPSYPDATYQKVPNMSQSREGQAILQPIIPANPGAPATPPSPDVEAKVNQDMTALQQTGEAKLNDFLTLSDTDKAAWLTANWDRLHAGDLTLEDLP